MRVFYTKYYKIANLINGAKITSEYKHSAKDKL